MVVSSLTLLDEYEGNIDRLPLLTDDCNDGEETCDILVSPIMMLELL